MCNLRDLLSTWEDWSTRNLLRRALKSATTEGQRAALNSSSVEVSVVDPLDALRDAAELVRLVSGWQWQAVHAARVEGASWEQIGEATGRYAEDGREEIRDAIERQESVLGIDISKYRGSLADSAD